MKIEEAAKPPESLNSRRFFRVGYLPTAASLLFLLVLLWGGAPRAEVSFAQAWRTAKALDAIEIVLIALSITLVSVLLQPLQHGIVRALEGYWPRWAGTIGRALHLRRKRNLERKVSAEIAKAAALPDEPDNAERKFLVQSAGVMAAKSRSRYPLSDHLVRPTLLGNVMTAAEDTAGSAYGLDAVVVWPRLYHVLGAEAKAHVDDLRDSVDASARLTATGVVTAAATAGLLAHRSGWWTLLALVPLIVALLAYSGAVRVAATYGLAVQVAFDLHRFDLLETMRREIPADRADELRTNRELSDFLRQAVPLTSAYVHPKDS